jgi:SAM-dependent methyltransferase
MLRDWSPRRIWWSARKILLPIHRDAVVLDVGSGGSPHPRADVLLERYVDPKHRFGAPLVADRPLVLGDACKMPFKDKAFDYVMAFHVLEHMSDPAQFLSELMRVSRAGYIETPNALFETLVPYDVHLLEILEDDGVLVIRKKESARPNSLISDRDLPTRDRDWNRLFFARPALFHVRYFWVDSIRHKVLNPDVSSAWFQEPEDGRSTDEFSSNLEQPARNLRTLGLKVMRRWYAWRRRNSRIKLIDLLACPECHGSLVEQSGRFICTCGQSFPVSPLPDFNRSMTP